MRQAMKLAIWAWAVFCAPALAQVMNDQAPRADGQQPDDDARRREWRDRMERMRNAGPEERERMRADMYVRMITRTYELNDDQQKRVHEEVVKMNREYRESLGDDAKRLEDFREQMDHYWRERRRDSREPQESRPNPMEDPKFRDIMTRMQEIQQRHPMDWEGSMKRIESMLPEEQAAAGRARREQWMAQNGNGQWGGGGTGGWGRMNRGNDQNNQGDGERSRRRDRRGDRGGRDGFFGSGQRDPAPAAGPESAKSGGASAQPGANAAPPPPTMTAAQPPVIMAPTHPWDTYTGNFIRTHGLDKNQTTAAWAIVKGLKEREVPIRRAQEPDRAAAAKFLNPQAKEARLKQLDAPIDSLYKELQERLDALLTAAQRKSSTGK